MIVFYLVHFKNVIWLFLSFFLFFIYFIYFICII